MQTRKAQCPAGVIQEITDPTIVVGNVFFNSADNDGRILFDDFVVNDKATTPLTPGVADLGVLALAFGVLVCVRNQRAASRARRR